ncbi:TPA: bacteriocin immunity protein [Enterococcus faecium]|nr:bacteriocin immunity protein [Enterococcus faecium]
MKKNAKQIVHELYNDISISEDPKYSDILEVLQKVYLKLEKQKYELDPGPLINRLVNYLYFTAYTNKIRFTEYQEELIRNLSEIGRTAGINGLYRADYGDKSQF